MDVAKASCKGESTTQGEDRNCPNCGEQCPSQIYYDWHCSLHCVVCGTYCLTKNLTRTHEKRCGQSGEIERLSDQIVDYLSKNLYCSICSKWFSDSHQAREHIADCADPPYDCIHCRRRFRRSAFERHVAECSERPVRCRYCGGLFPASALPDHSIRCPKKPHECSVCGAVVLSLEAFENHRCCHFDYVKALDSSTRCQRRNYHPAEETLWEDVVQTPAYWVARIHKRPPTR